MNESKLSAVQKIRIISLFILFVLLFLLAMGYACEIYEPPNTFEQVDDLYVDGTDFTLVTDLMIAGANVFVKIGTVIGMILTMQLLSLILFVPWRYIAIRKKSVIEQKEYKAAVVMLVAFSVITFIICLVITHFSYIVIIAILVVIPSVVAFLLCVSPLKDAYEERLIKTPILETDRLRLRPFNKDDAQKVFECWESDPDVAKYMFWTSHNDIEKTKEWLSFEVGQISKNDWYRFAIVIKETNELIGTVLIYYEEEVSCWEVGYNLGKKYWGMGYATEALKCVLDFAVKGLGIKEFVGRYAKENPASGNVMKKLGFKYEKDIPYECNDGAVMREGIQCRLIVNK